MKTIKIAPSMDEITVDKDEVRTDFAGGIKYCAEGLSKFKDEYVKKAFAAAIAIHGKRWCIEESLNYYFGLNGHVE